MTGSDEYGIQSIPPRYDEYNSYYIYTSEGYNRAVEEIDTEEGDMAEAEMGQRLNSEEIARLEEIKREDEKRILEEIHLKEVQREQQIADLSEYIQEDEIPPGTNVDLLA